MRRSKARPPSVSTSVGSRGSHPWGAGASSLPHAPGAHLEPEPGSRPTEGNTWTLYLPGAQSLMAKVAGDPGRPGPISHTQAALRCSRPLGRASGRTGSAGHQARGETIPELRGPSPASRSLSARWGGRGTWGGSGQWFQEPLTPALPHLLPPHPREPEKGTVGPVAATSHLLGALSRSGLHGGPRI